MAAKEAKTRAAERAPEQRPSDAKPTQRATGVQADLQELQRTAGNRAVSRSLAARREFSGEGQPLDPQTQGAMEARFGHDFGGVRVHTDSQAAHSAQAKNARAFTVGHDIAFDAGEYDPSSTSGRTLLAHELAHVVQQSRGGTAPPSLRANSPLEQSARQAATTAVHGGGTVQVAGASAPGVARDSPSLYDQIKEAAYKKLIDGAVALREQYFKGLHKGADLLPESIRGAAHTMINICHEVSQIVFNFMFYLVGVLVGLGEGVVGMIKGLLQMVYTILRYLKELAEAIMGRPSNLNEHWEETKQFLNSIGPGLKKIFDDWLTKFEGETQERQSAMIGELVGQVVAFVVTWEVSAAKIGKLGEATIPLKALQPAEEAVAAGTNVAAKTTNVAAKTAGGAESVTINLAKTGEHVGAAGLTGAEARQVGEKANQAQKEKPAQPEAKPKPEAKPQAETKPPQEKFPGEKAAGFSEAQTLAMEKFVGRNFDKIEQFNFKKLWEASTDANHLKITRANTNLSKGAKAQIRGYFDATRTRFWKAVSEDKVAKQVIEDAGFKFDKPGNAPKLTRPDGKTLSLDVDHQIRLTDNPSKALNPENLRLIFPRENRVVLEQIRKQDPFQNVP